MTRANLPGCFLELHHTDRLDPLMRDPSNLSMSYLPCDEYAVLTDFVRRSRVPWLKHAQGLPQEAHHCFICSVIFKGSWMIGHTPYMTSDRRKARTSLAEMLHRSSRTIAFHESRLDAAGSLLNEIGLCSWRMVKLNAEVSQQLCKITRATQNQGWLV